MLILRQGKAYFTGFMDEEGFYQMTLVKSQAYRFSKPQLDLILEQFTDILNLFDIEIDN